MHGRIERYAAEQLFKRLEALDGARTLEGAVTQDADAERERWVSLAADIIAHCNGVRQSDKFYEWFNGCAWDVPAAGEGV